MSTPLRLSSGLFLEENGTLELTVDLPMGMVISKIHVRNSSTDEHGYYVPNVVIKSKEVQEMSQTTIVFTKPHGSYVTGDIATLDYGQAQVALKKGVAQVYKEPVTEQPEELEDEDLQVEELEDEELLVEDLQVVTKKPSTRSKSK